MSEPIKIVEKSSPIKLSTVARGGLFRLGNELFYMPDVYEPPGQTESFIVINLSRRSVVYMAIDKMVIPVNGTLTIYD